MVKLFDDEYDVLPGSIFPFMAHTTAQDSRPSSTARRNVNLENDVLGFSGNKVSR